MCNGDLGLRSKRLDEPDVQWLRELNTLQLKDPLQWKWMFLICLTRPCIFHYYQILQLTSWLRTFAFILQSTSDRLEKKSPGHVGRNQDNLKGWLNIVETKLAILIQPCTSSFSSSSIWFGTVRLFFCASFVKSCKWYPEIVNHTLPVSDL